MAYPTNFTKYVEFILPTTSGLVTDITLPLSTEQLPTGLRNLIGSGAKDIRIYDDFGNELAYDPIVSGSGLSISGIINYRYTGSVTDNSFIRVYAGDNSLSLPSVSGSNGQYNAYDDYYEGYWYGLSDRTRNQRHLSTSGTNSYSTGPIANSSAINFNGTKQYTASLTGTPPRTLIGFAKSTDLSNNQSVICVGNSGNDTDFINLEMAGAAASNPVRAGARTSATSETFSSLIGYSTNVWTQVGAVEASAGTSRVVYKDGVAGTTNSSARNPTVNRVSIGATAGTTTSKKFSGDIFTPSVHSTNRSAEYIAYYNNVVLNHTGFYSNFDLYDYESVSVPVYYVSNSESILNYSNLSYDKRRNTLNEQKTEKANIDFQSSLNLTYGSGLGKINIIFYDEGQASEEVGSYDFAGSRLRYYGLDITTKFKNIKKIYIHNEGPSSLNISTVGENVFQSILGNPIERLQIESGCIFVATNPKGWEIDEDDFTNLTMYTAADETCYYSLLVEGEQS